MSYEPGVRQSSTRTSIDTVRMSAMGRIRTLTRCPEWVESGHCTISQSCCRLKRARCPLPDRTSMPSACNSVSCSLRTSWRYAARRGSGGHSTNVLSIPTCPFSFLIRDQLLHPSCPDLGSPPSMKSVKPAFLTERPSIDTATQPPSSGGPNASATQRPRGSNRPRKNTAQATINPAIVTIKRRRSANLIEPL